MANIRVVLLVLLPALCAAPAPAQQPGEGRGVRGAPADTSQAIPLAEWDDDWSYSEGHFRLFGQRFSLFAGATVTAFVDPSTRALYSGRRVSPDIDLYRPSARGLSPDVGFHWVGVTGAGRTARYLATTVGVRATFGEPAGSATLVPYATAAVGPYIVRASGAGSGTVLGANLTVGLEVARHAILAIRYDRLRAFHGLDLSTVSTRLSFRVPLGRPRWGGLKARGLVSLPGEMVEVNGHRLHLVCSGEGRPTVVLESGMSDAWVTWTPVQSLVARATRVCSYDRAGIGYSEPGPTPRTSGQIADELHALLARAGVPGPYVLVGHSFGGFVVRVFASRYRQEVAGMVLVDASHEAQLDRLPRDAVEGLDAGAESALRLAEQAERGVPVPPLTGNLPREVAARAAWYRAMSEEARALRASASEVASSRQPLDIPLVVITAGRQQPFGRSREARREMRRIWEELQLDLVRLSPRGSRVSATKSRHYVHRDQPAVVADAIARVVAEVRTAGQSP